MQGTDSGDYYPRMWRGREGSRTSQHDVWLQHIFDGTPVIYSHPLQNVEKTFPFTFQTFSLVKGTEYSDFSVDHSGYADVYVRTQGNAVAVPILRSFGDAYRFSEMAFMNVQASPEDSGWEGLLKRSDNIDETRALVGGTRVRDNSEFLAVVTPVLTDTARPSDVGRKWVLRTDEVLSEQPLNPAKAHYVYENYPVSLGALGWAFVTYRPSDAPVDEAFSTYNSFMPDEFRMQYYTLAVSMGLAKWANKEAQALQPGMPPLTNFVNVSDVYAQWQHLSEVLENNASGEPARMKKLLEQIDHVVAERSKYVKDTSHQETVVETLRQAKMPYMRKHVAGSAVTVPWAPRSLPSGDDTFQENQLLKEPLVALGAAYTTWMFMEKAVGGDLRAWLFANPHAFYSGQFISAMIVQLGVPIIHAQRKFRFCHGDAKLENVVVQPLPEGLRRPEVVLRYSINEHTFDVPASATDYNLLKWIDFENGAVDAVDFCVAAFDVTKDTAQTLVETSLKTAQAQNQHHTSLGRDDYDVVRWFGKESRDAVLFEADARTILGADTVHYDFDLLREFNGSQDMHRLAYEFTIMLFNRGGKPIFNLVASGSGPVADSARAALFTNEAERDKYQKAFTKYMYTQNPNEGATATLSERQGKYVLNVDQEGRVGRERVRAEMQTHLMLMQLAAHGDKSGLTRASYYALFDLARTGVRDVEGGLSQVSDERGELRYALDATPFHEFLVGPVSRGGADVVSVYAPLSDEERKELTDTMSTFSVDGMSTGQGGDASTRIQRLKRLWSQYTLFRRSPQDVGPAEARILSLIAKYMDNRASARADLAVFLPENTSADMWFLWIYASLARGLVSAPLDRVLADVLSREADTQDVAGRLKTAVNEVAQSWLQDLVSTDVLIQDKRGRDDVDDDDTEGADGDEEEARRRFGPSAQEPFAGAAAVERAIEALNLPLATQIFKAIGAVQHLTKAELANDVEKRKQVAQSALMALSPLFARRYKIFAVDKNQELLGLLQNPSSAFYADVASLMVSVPAEHAHAVLEQNLNWTIQLPEEMSPAYERFLEDLKNSIGRLAWLANEGGQAMARRMFSLYVTLVGEEVDSLVHEEEELVLPDLLMRSIGVRRANPTNSLLATMLGRMAGFDESLRAISSTLNPEGDLGRDNMDVETFFNSRDRLLKILDGYSLLAAQTSIKTPTKFDSLLFNFASHMPLDPIGRELPDLFDALLTLSKDGVFKPNPNLLAANLVQMQNISDPMDL